MGGTGEAVDVPLHSTLLSRDRTRFLAAIWALNSDDFELGSLVLVIFISICKVSVAVFAVLSVV
jgi:hypothetical protein